jgi:hypothetical protein
MSPRIGTLSIPPRSSEVVFAASRAFTRTIT